MVKCKPAEEGVRGRKKTGGPCLLVKKSSSCLRKLIIAVETRHRKEGENGKQNYAVANKEVQEGMETL